MVKQTQTIRLLLPTNCLSVFDHLVGLALKGLMYLRKFNKSTQLGVRFWLSQNADAQLFKVVNPVEHLRWRFL